MAWLVPDFETRSMCDLKKAGSYRYAEDPTTEVLCLNWVIGDGPMQRWMPGMGVPQAIVEAAANGTWFVAHNAAFERNIWAAIMVPEYGFPPVPLKQWHCTLAKAAMLALPQQLERVLKVLKLPLEKDMEGNRLTLGLSRINKKTGMLPELTEPIRERVSLYCDGDVLGQRGLHKRIGWFPRPGRSEPSERRVWELNQTVNDRGIRLDQALITGMRKIVDAASRPMEKEFKEITGLNLTQTQAMAGWLLDQGVTLPNMQKATLDSLLGTHEDDDFEPDLDIAAMREHMPPQVERALRIRQLIGSASIKKLGAMEACVMADGRARGLLQYHGTMPGRQAGRLFQPHNFPRGSTKVDCGPDLKNPGQRLELAPDPAVIADILTTGDAELVEMMYGPPVETCVSALRHTIIPAADRILMAGDLSGIQARTVLALAGQHDKAALMASGADVYIDMACTIWPKLPRPNWAAGKAVFKPEVELFKKRWPEERTTGKNSVLGLGFQMGAPKFHGQYGKGQSLEFIQDVVSAYREEWAPEVPKLWKALAWASLQTVKTGRPHEAYGVEYRLEDMWLTCRLHSGRKLWYAYPELTRRHMPWSTMEEPDIRECWTYQTMKMGQWKTVYPHGGLLTENVVMGIERDLMVHSALLCEANGYPIILEVHDELVAEPFEWDADERAMAQMMTDIPDWCRQLKIPVATETWADYRYKK